MQRQFTLSPIYLLIGLASSTAYAGGFQINEHSATGLGRAFAGDAVIGDNASVVSRNAAAMTLFKQMPYRSVSLTSNLTLPLKMRNIIELILMRMSMLVWAVFLRPLKLTLPRPSLKP